MGELAALSSRDWATLQPTPRKTPLAVGCSTRLPKIVPVQYAAAPRRKGLNGEKCENEELGSEEKDEAARVSHPSVEDDDDLCGGRGSASA